jgi:integrase
LGRRNFKLLPGLYKSKESRAAFGALVLELSSSTKKADEPAGEVLTVAELLLVYLEHATQHYRGPDGKPTSELSLVKAVSRTVREHYAALPVREFSPLKLKAVRQAWVGKGICRSECNRRTQVVRRIFKWGTAEELVKPVSVYEALRAVGPLSIGRTTARETKPVGPVDDQTVDATLPFLNRHVRGIVQFQRLTGCRPGEACQVRRCDLDMSGTVWLYRPVRHKTSWRGKTRMIAVGPKAQALLLEFFTPTLADYLFSPRRAMAEHNEDRTSARVTPRYPSHIERNLQKRKRRPRRQPGEFYDRTSYTRAVARACEQAFPLPAALARETDESATGWHDRLTDQQRVELLVWRTAHRWHPNQIRHTYATAARKVFGLEHAAAALGHTKMSTTEVYAERDVGLAVEVAIKLG